MMNIDTERVILEVQKHPVIWDPNFDLYKSKDARQAAWVDICTNLVDNFHEMTSGKQKSVGNLQRGPIIKIYKNTNNRSFVIALEHSNKGIQVSVSDRKMKIATFVVFQKKWKTVRDYYIRDKKREIETSVSAMKKRKINPYFKLLEFLNDRNANQETTNSPSNLASSDLLADEDDKSPEKDDSSDDGSSYDQSSRATEAVLTSPDTASSRIMVMRRWTKIIETDNDEDPNRHFLLSLLPEMSKMTERQNFKFRFEIMKILNKIRYQVAD